MRRCTRKANIDNASTYRKGFCISVRFVMTVQRNLCYNRAEELRLPGLAANSSKHEEIKVSLTYKHVDYPNKSDDSLTKNKAALRFRFLP